MKVIISTITSGYLPIDLMNANFAALQTAMENTYSRDGTGPNTLGADMDANSFHIINLGTPVNSSDAATKNYVDVMTPVGTSTTNNTVSLGSKTFVIDSIRPFVAGTWVQMISRADVTNFMYGQVTSVSGATLVVNSTQIGGSGAHTDWTITQTGPAGGAGPRGNSGSGAGNVIGPLTSVDNNVVFWDGVLGAYIKDSGLTLSGSNTGDQTSVSGNAGTATKLATIRAISGVDFDGSASITIDHTGLTGVGSNTHAQIDTALTRLANTSGTNTGDQTTISGNAATATKLAATKTIYGNAFDGSADLTQVIASAYGGTNSAYFQVAGPTTLRIFTFPDAPATILYSGSALGTPASGNGSNITNVNAATLGSATFAAPGAIGGTTPSTAAFTSGTYSSTLGVTGQITGTTIKLTTGASNGYVLTSDAVGFASWQASSSGMVYKGAWDASTNTPTLADGSGTSGWTYAVSVGGVQFGRTFVTGGWAIYNGAIWQAIGTATPVLILASSTFANQGTTTTVLHGNAAGNPSWTAVVLTTDVSGILPVANGGTGTSTGTISNLTSPFNVGVTSVTTTGAQLNYLNAATNTTGSTASSVVFSTSPTLVTPIMNTAAHVGGTWVADATWTLPAHTLGGTVSGGGNQINNVIIGTVTPLAGTFTALIGTTVKVTTPPAMSGGITGYIPIYGSSNSLSYDSRLYWQDADHTLHVNAASLSMALSGGPMIQLFNTQAGNTAGGLYGENTQISPNAYGNAILVYSTTEAGQQRSMGGWNPGLNYFHENVVTISNGSPGVVTFTVIGSQRFGNDVPVAFHTTGTLPSPLQPNVRYYVISFGVDGTYKFRVSSTLGGSAITTTTGGSGTHYCGSFFGDFDWYVTSGGVENGAMLAFFGGSNNPDGKYAGQPSFFPGADAQIDLGHDSSYNSEPLRFRRGNFSDVVTAGTFTALSTAGTKQISLGYDSTNYWNFLGDNGLATATWGNGVGLHITSNPALTTGATSVYIDGNANSSNPSYPSGAGLYLRNHSYNVGGPTLYWQQPQLTWNGAAWVGSTTPIDCIHMNAGWKYVPVGSDGPPPSGRGVANMDISVARLDASGSPTTGGALTIQDGDSWSCFELIPNTNGVHGVVDATMWNLGKEGLKFYNGFFGNMVAADWMVRTPMIAPASDGVDAFVIKNGGGAGNVVFGINTTSGVCRFPYGFTSAAGCSVTGTLTATTFSGAHSGDGSALTGVTTSSLDANSLTGNTLHNSVLYSSLTTLGTVSGLTCSGNISATSGNIYGYTLQSAWLAGGGRRALYVDNSGLITV